METIDRTIGPALVALFVCSVPAVASADGSLYDWPSETSPVLVTNDSGVMFVGADRKVERAYTWDRAGGEHKQDLFLADLDKNGGYEVVGGGDPSFALKTNGDPFWTIEDGCAEIIVANFAADEKLDVMCNRGSAVHIYTYDKQKVWSLDPGIPIDHCRAGDVNGDLMMDLECVFEGRDDWIRIDADGTILAESSTEQEIPEDGVDLEEAQPVSKPVWNGEREYDLNGDGAAEESITADGNSLVIQSRSKKSAVARVELDGAIQSALVKNIDREGNSEIVVLTDSEIAVLSAGGEVLGTFPADTRDYSREPVAAFESVYARKFSDKKKATKAVRNARGDFAACYADQVRAKFPTGTGQIILKGYVGSGGEVKNIEMMHSAINDSEIESCAQEVLRGLDFPGLEKGGEEGDGAKEATVNVVINYTFADRP